MEIKQETLGLTAYDIINHLIPGTTLVLFLFLSFQIKITVPIEILILGLLVLGYLTGQFLSIIGTLLFNSFFYPDKTKGKTIGNWFLATIHKIVKFVIRQNYSKTDSEKELLGEISQSIKIKLGLKNLDDKTVFEICDSLASEIPCADRDVLLAKQGFYRSTSALLLILLPYTFLTGAFGIPGIYWAVAIVILIRLLIYGNAYYGQIRKKQIYHAAYRKLKGGKKLWRV